ncbi:MAG: response regulator transcription factor [Bacteroidetes bacterium]|nr:response regulator transcription factor [Bacteroidota bacterium]
MNCLVVEDEPLAAGIIIDYISQIPGLVPVGKAVSAMEASAILSTSNIDLIFLDINLPVISGIDFAKTLDSRYQIIFTTAYHEFAIESYALNAVDYLLKPISFPRFMQAVNRAFERKAVAPKVDSVQVREVAAERKSFFFNTDKKQMRVFADEILYVESLKDYVKIITRNGHVVTRYQLGDMMLLLKDCGFIRIHKSFIVNVAFVTAYNARDLEIGKISLPIGRTFKELVEKHLGGPDLQ